MKKLFLLLFLSLSAHSKDYIIFSIEHDFPMYKGQEDQLKKNYFLSMGSEQGISTGSVLNVYRSISELDPYENKKRYDFKVKIGELEVVHAEKNASIARNLSTPEGANSPLFEIKDLMIGDKVEIKVD